MANADSTDKSSGDFYEIDDKKKKAYIFNNSFVDDPVYKRLGAIENAKKIDQCLSKRGFEVQSFEDPTAKQIQEEIEKVSKLRKSEVSCIVIIIMTHGGKNELCAKDGNYNLYKTIFKPFKDNELDLNGIPKLFFIEACRGTKVDFGHRIENLQFDGITRDEEKIPDDLLESPDMLCMFPTADDHKAYEFRNGDSWLIQGICKSLETYQEKKNLLHLLTRVNFHVAELPYAGVECKKEMPHIACTLTKILMF